MRKIQSILLFLFFTGTIFSQTDPIVNEKSKTPAPADEPYFELELRRYTAVYSPYEYNRAANTSSQYSPTYSELRGNTSNIVPIYLNYYNKSSKFRIEASYQRIEIARANYTETDSLPSGISRGDATLAPTARTDIKVNAYADLSLHSKHELYWGVGVRSIQKLRTDAYSDGSLYESIHTFGPELALRYNFSITKDLSFRTGIDTYYVKGSRTYENVRGYNYITNTTSGAYYRTYIGGPQTVATFFGTELDLSLAYKFLDKYSLSVGYNYNEAWFKYENYQDTFLSYDTGTKQSQYGGVRSPAAKEVIRGYYVGVSTKF